MTRPIGITGGAGFLAHSAARSLATMGREAHLLDSQAPPSHRPAEAPIVLADIRDASAVDEFVLSSSAVIHYAAVVGVDAYLNDPGDVIDINVNGSRLVLEACLRHDRPVVFASTSEVYGKNPERLREDSASLFGSSANSRWSYAVSKSAGEHLANSLARRGLRCVTTRYFNAYGPQMDRPGHGRVISKFIGRLQEGRPLQLVDGGDAVRCFCFAEETVRATLELLFALESGKLASGRTFNVGRDEPVSMRQLAELMLHLCSQPTGTEDVAGVEAFGEGFEEVPRRVPDLTAIQDEIGFEAKIDLEEGLSRVLDHWGLLRRNASPPPRALIPMIQPQFEPTLALAGDLTDVLQSGRVSNDGPRVGQFEHAVAEFLGVERAVAVGSGTAALELSARAYQRSLNGARGAQVILPAFTYIATLSAVFHAGFEPIFCDIDADTFTMAPEALAELLDEHPNVRLIVPVNTYGVPPAMDRLRKLSEAHGAGLIVDNAHGLGTESSSGSRTLDGALATTYSLHATKNLPAVEGGLVVSPDGAFLDEVVRLRGHGWLPDRLKSSPGFNARLDELRGIIGLSQLQRFEAALRRRRAYADRLRAAATEKCAGFFTVQRIPEETRSGFQNLAVRCSLPTGVTVENVSTELSRHGVDARRYFAPPLHLLPSQSSVPARPLPNTDAVYASLLCLPLHNQMSEQTLSRIEYALGQTAEHFGLPASKRSRR